MGAITTELPGRISRGLAEVGVELPRATAPTDATLIDAADGRRSAHPVTQEAEIARLAVPGLGEFGVTLIELGLAAGA